ncbi:MAG: hypothetical protein JKY94_15740 [Rhodobacteraceae bacterium]|nr:hypothetical protein [Paracoccaceae bacterium]
MAEVVLLISSLIFVDLQNGAAGEATAEALLRETKKFDAEINFASAFPNSEQSGTIYLTILIDNQAQQFAEIVCKFDGVYSCYVKPGAEHP